MLVHPRTGFHAVDRFSILVLTTKQSERGRMPQSKTSDAKRNNGANLGFEEKLWQAADKLRGHMDAAEYKHVVLGLVFLKYISDAFEEKYAALLKERNADPEDRD